MAISISPMGAMNTMRPINAYYKTTPVGVPRTTPMPGEDFATVFDAAKNLLIETNNMQITAENEVTKFLLGESDNAHDAMIAGQEATIALQYTNAIRTNVIQSYQQLMQMQI